MGKIIGPIAERTAARLAKQQGFHAVGGVSGLYLCVSRGGGRSWILRYNALNGRRRDLGLGSLADLTLSEARDAASAARKLLKQGIDPIDSKRAQLDALRAAAGKRMSFKQCFEGFYDAHADGWRNDKHALQWKRSLKNHADALMSMDVAMIDTPHILKVLEPIWREKTEAASRVRGRIESVLNWAAARGYRRGENPARWKGHLDQLLPRPSKIRQIVHYPALPHPEIGDFMSALRKHEGAGARALEFAILTAARSGEVRGAQWSEINLKERIWTIPAGRMKAGKQHVVPLSEAALAILRRMQREKLNEFVFPGTRDDKPLSDMSLTAVLRRMGRRDLTAHGFRSTFRDWCAEATSYPHEMAEMALAHAIGNKTEAAYRRGNMLAKRFRLMADWAKRCAEPTRASSKAAVVPIRRKAKSVG